MALHAHMRFHVERVTNMKIRTALLSHNSRTTDSPTAAKSAVSLFRLMPRPTACALLNISLMFCFVAFAADEADRAKLLGIWQSPDSKDAWLIEGKGASLHITLSQGPQKVIEFQCNTEGKECEGKDSGHKATATLYYNGGKLIQIETKGEAVVKRRFGVADEVLEVETMPLAPAGQAEKVKFTRTANSH